MSFRIFVAWPDGTIAFDEVTDAVAEAMDIMIADRVPEDTAAKMAVTAEKTGKDPVAFARHFVKVRRQFRETEGERK